jgi:tRNA(Ile)-lysidine synthetase-like protein
MRPAGMDGTRKLQDIFIEAKVPRGERGRVPLLYFGAECIWVVGVKRSERAPASPRGGHGELSVAFKAVSEQGDAAAGDATRAGLWGVTSCNG